MVSLFSACGMEHLQRFMADGPVFVGFDFDGTLAPIVRSPSKAVCSPEVLTALSRLARHAAVGVISGRGVADLESRLPVRGIRLIGNHGAEGLGLSASQLAVAQSTCSAWETSLRASFREGKLGPPIFIENKGLTLSVHYRGVLNGHWVLQEILRATQALKPLPRVVMGKCVINLLPLELPHKGVALQWAMEAASLRRAIYIGDDETDEDVFRMERSDLFGIQVGKNAASRAYFYIEQQEEIILFLRLLNELQSLSREFRLGPSS